MMIIGHQKQWKFLAKSMEQGKIPQALLFSGEQNLGKKFVALEFVKLLNCEKPNNNKPCEICKNCQSIAKKIHPDLTIIEPIEKEIQIFQIRQLIKRLALHSMSQGFKAIIIDNADSLNQEAQNAFLKLLEEPKGKTIFILIAEHRNKLFSTILSRTQTLKFYPVAKQEMEKFLLRHADFVRRSPEGAKEEAFGEGGLDKKIPASQIQEIISLSCGRPGRAINFLLHPEEIEVEKQRIKQIQELIDSDIAFRFQYAKQISDDRDKLKQTLEVWLRYFRTKMIDELKVRHPVSGLQKILKRIQETQFLLSTTNVNSKLALELLMLEI